MCLILLQAQGTERSNCDSASHQVEEGSAMDTVQNPENQKAQCTERNNCDYTSHQVEESDNGPQFISEEFEDFLKRNGVKHVKVAPYHAASNGAAERMVPSFKRSLTASKAQGRGVQQCLDNFLLGYRSTKHATTGQSPASLFGGFWCGDSVRQLSCFRIKEPQFVLCRTTVQLGGVRVSEATTRPAVELLRRSARRARKPLTLISMRTGCSDK